jgi:hypothetical protein
VLPEEMGERVKDHGGSRDYHGIDHNMFLRRKPDCGGV